MHARMTKTNVCLTIPESNVLVTIELTYAEIDCLLSHLPIGSDLSVKLATAETAVFPTVRLVESPKCFNALRSKQVNYCGSSRSMGIPTPLKGFNEA